MTKPTIQAIPTHYNGYQFRSRLEARWAVFFGALNIEYQYEPEGFVLPDGTKYLPDFWLPDVRFRFWKPANGLTGTWFEVKGLAQESDFDKLNRFAKAVNQPVVLADGAFDGGGPILTHWLYGAGETADNDCWWDQGLIFMKCPKCWKFRIQYPVSSYQDCDVCGANSEFIYWDHLASDLARSASFEFNSRL